MVDWPLSRVLWIDSSLLLEVRFVRLELLSFKEIGSSIPVIVHVSELVMDLFDLPISQSISFSVDQALDSCKLINESEFWIISLEVDSIKVSLQKLLVQNI